MLQPTPALPGEFFLGHLERIHRFNGLNTRAATYRCLARIADINTDGGWRQNRAVVLSLLAAFDNIPILEYCAHHTTLQYQVFARQKGNCSVDAGQVRAKLRTAKQQFMCVECAKADRGRAGAGYPFLRVAHQVPGVRWCVDHVRPLLPCQLSGKPIAGLPHYDGKVTPIMRRFAEVSVGMLSPGQTIDAQVFSRTVGAVARATGLQQVGNVQPGRQFLSSRIEGLVDASWLEELFPGYALRDKSRPFWPVDGALARRGGATTAFALTLALAFSTTREALACIESMRAAAPKIPRMVNILDDGAIYKAYVASKGNLSQMVKELGWRRSVLQHLRREVIPSLHGTSLLAQALREVIHCNTPTRTAARRYGADHARLVRLLSRGGDALRSAIVEVDLVSNQLRPA